MPVTLLWCLFINFEHISHPSVSIVFSIPSVSILYFNKQMIAGKKIYDAKI